MYQTVAPDRHVFREARIDVRVNNDRVTRTFALGKAASAENIGVPVAVRRLPWYLLSSWDSIPGVPRRFFIASSSQKIQFSLLKRLSDAHKKFITSDASKNHEHWTWRNRYWQEGGSCQGACVVEFSNEVWGICLVQDMTFMKTSADMVIERHQKRHKQRVRRTQNKRPFARNIWCSSRQKHACFVILYFLQMSHVIMCHDHLNTNVEVSVFLLYFFASRWLPHFFPCDLVPLIVSNMCVSCYFDCTMVSPVGW